MKKIVAVAALAALASCQAPMRSAEAGPCYYARGPGGYPAGPICARPPGSAWVSGAWDYSAALPPPVPLPPAGPPPLGWVFGPYTVCGDPPRCSTGVVSVQADGLNVRVAPGGVPVMALVNGTPLIPMGKEGDWLLVAAACDLTPTFAWSWTAGVPLNRCWIY